MPGTYQGNATHNTAVAVWQATHAYVQGNLVQPTPGTGQVFICTVAGTSGGSQPAWSSAPFPTIGTLFTDGGVTWMMYQTVPGAWPIVIQQPVDVDQPLAFPQIIPEQTIADQAAWVVANAGLLGSNNTWTGTNTWNGQTTFNAVATVSAGTGINLVLNGSVPGIFSLATPGSGYIILDQFDAGAGTFGFRRYLGPAGVSTAVNASWTGTQWQYDDSTQPATLFSVTKSGVFFSYRASGLSSPWNDASWSTGVQMFGTGTPGVTFSIPITVNGSASFTGAATFSNTTTINAALFVNGSTVTNNLSVVNQVNLVGGQSTAGALGVPVVVSTSYNGGTGVSIGTSFTNVFPDNANAGPKVVGGRFYEFKLYMIGSGTVAPGAVTAQLVGTVDGTIGPLNDTSGGRMGFVWVDTANNHANTTLGLWVGATQDYQLQLKLVTGTAVAFATLVCYG